MQMLYKACILNASNILYFGLLGEAAFRNSLVFIKMSKMVCLKMWIINLSNLQHCCKMQKYHKNRLLCGSNLTILLYGRRQLLHLLWVTLYISRLENAFGVFLHILPQSTVYACSTNIWVQYSLLSAGILRTTSSLDLNQLLTVRV